jgi:hypothetical protein
MNLIYRGHLTTSFLLIIQNESKRSSAAACQRPVIRQRNARTHMRSIDASLTWKRDWPSKRRSGEPGVAIDSDPRLDVIADDRSSSSSEAAIVAPITLRRG